MDKIETQIGGIEKIDEAVRLLHEGEVVSYTHLTLPASDLV